MRPLLLDLFCGAGGAAMGYWRAGFDVVGVDKDPQPLYPFEFIQADAIQVLEYIADDAEPWPGAPYPAAIHASPPCQHFVSMSNKHRGRGGEADSHPDLVTPTRELLYRIGLPFVLENVLPAKRAMRATLTLHGGQFDLGVHRPRIFESNVLILAPDEPAAKNVIGVYGKAPDGRLLWARADGTELHAAASLAAAQAAMGMDWGDWHGVKEAIPPAYTEFIGRQLISFCERPVPRYGNGRTEAQEKADDSAWIHEGMAAAFPSDTATIPDRR